MRVEKQEDGNFYLYLSDDCFIHSVNEWRQMFGKYNWISCHLIHIYFENDIMCPGYEFEFIVLGLGFRIRINKKDFMQKMKQYSDRNKNPVVKTVANGD